MSLLKQAKVSFGTIDPQKSEGIRQAFNAIINDYKGKFAPSPDGQQRLVRALSKHEIALKFIAALPPEQKTRLANFCKAKGVSDSAVKDYSLH